MYIVRQIGRLWTYIPERNATLYDIVHMFTENVIILFNGDTICEGIFSIYLRKKVK